MWRALGLADIFAGHDAHVTIAERIGQPDCTIPTCGLSWITTPQPVVLDAWPATPLPAGPPRFTSIASWRGAYGPIDYEGHRYGLRVHQLRRFADLPGRTPRPIRAGARHPSRRARRRGAAARPRLGAGRSRRSGVDAVALPQLPPGLERRADGGQGHVRRHRRRLVQRAQHLLPGQRPTGACPGHRPGGPLPARPRARWHSRRWTRRRPASSRSWPITAGHAADARALAEAHFDSDRVLSRLAEQVAG